MDLTPHLNEFLTSDSAPEVAAGVLLTKIKTFHALFNSLLSAPLLGYTEDQLSYLEEFMSSNQINIMDNEIGNFDEASEFDQNNNNNDENDQNTLINRDIPRGSDVTLTKEQSRTLVNNIRQDQVLFSELLQKVTSRLFHTEIGSSFILNNHSYLLLLSGNGTYYRRVGGVIPDFDQCTEFSEQITQIRNMTHTTSSTPLPPQHPSTMLFLSTFFSHKNEPTEEEDVNNIVNTAKLSSNSHNAMTISHSPMIQSIIGFILDQYEVILRKNIEIMTKNDFLSESNDQNILFKSLTPIPTSLQSTLITLLQANDIETDRITTLLALVSLFHLLLNLHYRNLTQNNPNTDNTDVKHLFTTMGVNMGDDNVLKNTIFDGNSSFLFFSRKEIGF